MRTVVEFNISVIIVTKMITYKFLRGVLLRMHDRSADGVFHFAILALPDSVNVDCFSPVPAKVPAGKSKTTSIKFCQRKISKL